MRSSEQLAIDRRITQLCETWGADEVLPHARMLVKEAEDALGVTATSKVRELAALALTGGAFLKDAEAEIPAVWGNGGTVAWAAGEPLWIVGPPGVGKSTLAQHLVLGRMGVRTGRVLGMPVAECMSGSVLYVAADRPRQVARSLRRMVSQDELGPLNDGWLRVWTGPLPFDVAKDRDGLADLAAAVEATTVVIDSVKDVTLDLNSDAVGAGVNQALQACVARGIEVVAVHHQRKAQAGNKAPRRLDDVFGSTFLMGGAGSVILLWGREYAAGGEDAARTIGPAIPGGDLRYAATEAKYDALAEGGPEPSRRALRHRAREVQRWGWVEAQRRALVERVLRAHGIDGGADPDGEAARLIREQVKRRLGQDLFDVVPRLMREAGYPAIFWAQPWTEAGRCAAAEPLREFAGGVWSGAEKWQGY
jgi:hypothetical protein